MANSLFIIHKNTSHDKKQRRKCFLAKALHFNNPESFLAGKFHYFFLHHFSKRKKVPLKKKDLYPSVHTNWAMSSLLGKSYYAMNQHAQIFSAMPKANCDLEHIMYFPGLWKNNCVYVTQNIQLITRKCSLKSDFPNIEMFEIGRKSSDFILKFKVYYRDRIQISEEGER